MPEMPEIETIARKLRQAILGKRIQKVYLSGLPLRKPVAAAFPIQVEGRGIRRIHRRGKYLILELEPLCYCLIHLGMSGRIVLDRSGSQVKKHTQAIFYLSDATELRYLDHRRFGLLATYEVRRLRQIPELESLGIDPLSARFRQDWLSSELRKSRREIKSLLLDQQKIAGLGNIYACEALYCAGIHPARRCHTLTRDETRKLTIAIQRVVRGAIRHRGTSFSDFMDSDGQAGENQNYLKVFQREGRKCRRCKTGIQRIRQGNRSSFYCPRCQTE